MVNFFSGYIVPEAVQTVSVQMDLEKKLKQQDKLEPLLKEMPAHVARLAEGLPQLSGDLSRILRETKHLQLPSGGLIRCHARAGAQQSVQVGSDVRLTLVHRADCVDELPRRRGLR